jgi:hypothetical protein
MENAHADHHSNVAYVVHYTGDKVASMVFLEKGVRQRHEAGVEITPKFELDIPGSIQDAHPGGVSQETLEKGRKAGCGDGYGKPAATGSETVHGIFDEQRN